MSPKRTILLAELFVSSTQGGPYRFSSEQWYSNPGDSVGVLEFSGRIVGDPTFQQQAGCAIWGSQSSSVSIGAIDLANTDGGVTHLLGAATRGAICVLRLVTDGDGYDQSVIVAQCDIDRIEQHDETIRIVLSPMDARLNRPMQSIRFPDDAPNPSVRGTPQPISMGRCLQVEPAMFAAGFDSGTYITHAATPINTNLARPQTITHGADTPQWDWTYNPGQQSSNAQIADLWAAAPGTYSYPSPDCLNTDFSGVFALIPEEALITGIELTAEVSIAIVDPAQDDGSDWTNEASVQLLGLTGPSDTRTMTLPAPGTGEQNIVFGGANDKWGYTHISRQNIASTSFGASLVFTPSITLVSAGTYKIYRDYFLRTIRLRVYYALSSADYRVSDGYVDQVTEVYAGGSVARPPTHVQPQWQYNPQQSGFEMLIQPATRVTADIYGVADRGFDILSGSGDFASPFNWSGTLTGWTVNDGAVSEDRDFGAIMDWTAAASSQIETNSAVLSSTDSGWYVVAGSAPDIPLDAQIEIDLAGRGSATVTQPGDFFIPVFVSAGAAGPVTVTASGTATAGGFAIIRSVSVRSMQTSSSSSAFGAISLVLERCGMLGHSPIFPLELASAINDLAVVGLYTKDSMTGRRAIDMIMGGFAGWLYATPDGLVQAGALIDPVTYPAITISSLNLTAYPIYRDDLAPGLSDVFSGQVVWSPYSEQELAGITYEDRQHFMTDARLKLKGASALHRFYRDRVGAEPYRSVFDSEVDLQYQADRITELYSRKRGFWHCTVALDTPVLAAGITLGTHVRLSDPDVFGPNDIDGIVVGVEGRYRNNVVALTIWS